MYRTCSLLLAGLLVALPVRGAEPEVEPAVVPEPPPPQHFQVSLARPPAPRCLGPMVAGAPPCTYFATLGTAAVFTTLQILRPVDYRLVRASSVSPTLPGQPVLRSGAKTAPGLLMSGYSSDPLFIGLGSFDMRTPIAP
jgi:hypothetical protein